MITRQTRLLATFHVLLDGLLGPVAFALAYALRFETFLTAPKGQPPFTQYLVLMPFVALLVPLAFYLQGAYRLRRIRTRVDDFFSVLVGNVLVVVIGLLGTLYFQVYYATAEAQTTGAYEVSRLVWGLFLGINVVLTYSSRGDPASAGAATIQGRARSQTRPHRRRGRPGAARRRQDSSA